MILSTVQYGKLRGWSRSAVYRLIERGVNLPGVYKIEFKDKKYLLHTNDRSRNNSGIQKG